MQKYFFEIREYCVIPELTNLQILFSKYFDSSNGNPSRYRKCNHDSVTEVFCAPIIRRSVVKNGAYLRLAISRNALSLSAESEILYAAFLAVSKYMILTRLFLLLEKVCIKVDENN